MSISEIIKQDFNALVSDIKFFKDVCKLQYNFLKDEQLLGLEVGKTISVAAITGLTTGLLCGTPVGFITFAVTAVYVGSIGRLGNFKSELEATQNFIKNLPSFSPEESKFVKFFVSYAKVFAHCIERDIHSDLKSHKGKFKKIDVQLQNYAIAKIGVVAATFGLTTGLFCGTALGLITFAVTAVYVKGAIVRRVGESQKNKAATIAKGQDLGVLEPKPTKDVNPVGTADSVAKGRFEIFRNTIYFAMSL